MTETAIAAYWDEVEKIAAAVPAVAGGAAGALGSALVASSLLRRQDERDFDMYMRGRMTGQDYERARKRRATAVLGAGLAGAAGGGLLGHAAAGSALRQKNLLLQQGETTWRQGLNEAGEKLREQVAKGVAEGTGAIKLEGKPTVTIVDALLSVEKQIKSGLAGAPREAIRRVLGPPIRAAMKVVGG